MINKPTETATFDKELFLWVDGITKLNAKRQLYKTGVWKYYDLGGKLVATRKYNKNGKKIAEQFFPPQSIDVNAVMMSFDDIFEAMYWIKEAPTNADGEKHGIYQEWYRKYNDEVLTKHALKRKTIEQLTEIWENSAWWLREVHYKNGEIIWIKNYNRDGEVEYESDSTDENIDNEEITTKKSKQSVRINHKAPAINYTKTFIYSQDLADKIQPLSAEQRQHINAIFEEKYTQLCGYDYFGEEARFAYCDWQVYEGDLVIEDNFFSDMPLVITGNLTVKGNYLDDAVGGVIVCGDMQVKGNIISQYPLLVVGNTTVTGLMCLHYNDYSCEFLGDISCDLLYVSDRAVEMLGEINAQSYYDLDNDNAEKEMKFLQKCLKMI